MWSEINLSHPLSFSLSLPLSLPLSLTLSLFTLNLCYGVNIRPRPLGGATSSMLDEGRPATGEG